MSGNPAVTQHDASYPHPNTISQLSSFNLSFNALEKLLEYEIESKLRCNLLFHEEINGLIQESEKESNEYDSEIGRLESAIVSLRQQWKPRRLSSVREITKRDESRVRAQVTIYSVDYSSRDNQHRDRQDNPR
jgi:predicted  nucleic acid-binding Zn-ribbon protein